MGGFSSITGDETIMNADNASFDGTERGGKMTTNGQLWIGATASPHVRLGSLSSTGGTVSISTGAGTINLEAGAAVPTSFVANSGSANAAGNILNILGTTAAAGTTPLVTTGAGNTITVVGQISQALAAADATKIGLSNFDSTSFAVAATGFVTLSTTGAGKTITGDTGGALSPTANNWNILGGPGVTTTGSGSTLTINSVVFTDQAGSTSVTSDSGSFATAAITLTLPGSPAQGELVQFACTTANALVVDAPGTHLIRIGTLVTSAGGTATSTAIGDSLTLRYYAASTTWIATSVVGTWVMA